VEQAGSESEHRLIDVIRMGFPLGAFIALVLDHASAAELCLFAIVLSGFWLAEFVFRQEPGKTKLQHSAINATFLVGVLPVQLSLITLCIAAANWATDHRFGLIYLLPDTIAPWLRYALMFLALDFLDYCYHVLSHHAPPIWRLHVVHHSDRALDVSTTFREHPFETAVRVIFLSASVLACGASLPVLVLRQTVQTFSNLVQHTRFELPPRLAKLFGFVFITPNLHHIHHHHRRPGTDCNYGDVFSIWDRLFGTFVDLPTEEIVFGLDTHEEASRLSIPELLGWNGLIRRLTA
jgi:sterol desaturase/sphingolipid hydroxylase (fatty acid hydroxylase superfamily)